MHAGGARQCRRERQHGTRAVSQRDPAAPASVTRAAHRLLFRNSLLRKDVCASMPRNLSDIFIICFASKIKPFRDTVVFMLWWIQYSLFAEKSVRYLGSQDLAIIHV